MVTEERRVFQGQILCIEIFDCKTCKTIRDHDGVVQWLVCIFVEFWESF
jgi:hypothetical protein